MAETEKAEVAEAPEKGAEAKTEVQETKEGNMVVDPTNRPLLVELKDKKVNVLVYQCSMSKIHKAVIGIDLIMVVAMASLATFLFCRGNGPYWGAGIVTGISILWFIKVFADIRNWIYTMNVYLQKMGEWYQDDIADICTDLINAGVEYAAKEVAKAKGEKVATAEPKKD